MSATSRWRHGDRVLEVSVQLDGDAVRATVDGQAIEAARLPPAAPPHATAGAVVHEVAFIAGGRTYRAVVARGRDRTLVALNGRTYAFATGDEATGHGGGAAGTGKVAAPMPGKVIAVLVRVGDRVAHGQGVLVLEAMKMETTLAADVDGEVTRVAATVGETVDGGVVLVEITPS